MRVIGVLAVLLATVLLAGCSTPVLRAMPEELIKDEALK